MLPLGVLTFALRYSGYSLARRKGTAQNLFGFPNKAPQALDNPDGLLKNAGNMMESLKKAQDMAKQFQTLNGQFAQATVTGYDSTGKVSAMFNGVGVPVSISIPDEVLLQGSEAVSRAASEAMLNAHTKAKDLVDGRLKEMFGGMNLNMDDLAM